jgi:hypothetical protein
MDFECVKNNPKAPVGFFLPYSISSSPALHMDDRGLGTRRCCFRIVELGPLSGKVVPCCTLWKTRLTRGLDYGTMIEVEKECPLYSRESLKGLDET